MAVSEPVVMPPGRDTAPAEDTQAERSTSMFSVYQELKSSVHRELLNRLDLEKIATVRDERTRAQAFSVIEELVDNIRTPLSGPEKDRLAREVLNEVFGLGP